MLRCWPVSLVGKRVLLVVPIMSWAIQFSIPVTFDGFSFMKPSLWFSLGEQRDVISLLCTGPGALWQKTGQHRWSFWMRPGPWRVRINRSPYLCTSQPPPAIAPMWHGRDWQVSTCLYTKNCVNSQISLGALDFILLTHLFLRMDMIHLIY